MLMNRSKSTITPQKDEKVRQAGDVTPLSETAGEIETGTVVKGFTNGAVVQVVLVARSVRGDRWSEVDQS